MTFHHAIPIPRVTDLTRTLACWRDRLGFTLDRDVDDDVASVGRGKAQLPHASRPFDAWLD